MAVFFLYIPLYLCQGIKAYDFMYFIQAKQARAEAYPPLWLWIVCGDFLGYCMLLFPPSIQLFSSWLIFPVPDLLTVIMFLLHADFCVGLISLTLN